MQLGREPHLGEETNLEDLSVRDFHPKQKIGFIVAPHGEAGGGMGRVKDYIIQYAGRRALGVTLLPLITRDGGGKYRSLLLTAIAICRIAAARFSGRLAFVHVNMGDGGSAVRKGLIVIATKWLGAPVLLHLHAVELQHRLVGAGTLLRGAIRRPFLMATRVAVLGETWKRWVIGELGVPEERVHVLWNGVPVKRDREPVQRSPDSPLQILFLGNLTERKGVSDLLSSLELLSPDLDWRLTLAGGGEVGRYSAAVERAGLSGRVTFTGWVEQPIARSLLLAADVLVLPSYDEGLPLVILEALGSGTPVICTPVGSIPEVLVNDETAIFCKAGDAADLAKALARVISDQDLRARLSAAGLKKFSEQFSIEAFLAALFHVYREGLGSDIQFGPRLEFANDSLHS